MSLPTRILSTPSEVGAAVADLIVERLRAARGRRFLLGCPSGRTPLPVYGALARHAAAGVDLSNLVVVMMDDYLDIDESAGPRVVDSEKPYSCLGFAQREIIAPLAAASGRAGTHAPSEIWTADPADPDDYDRRIAGAGGIDLFLLASGDSDGHVAFNQPGTPRDRGTHLVELGEATRRDNMHTFPGFTSLSMVPSRGVTVGIDTIAALSREAVMILAGAHKREAFARVTAARCYEPDWPATIVTECRGAQVIADLDAAGALTPSGARDDG